MKTGAPRLALLFLALSLTPTLPLHAHPGVGIIRDSRGNVFYTESIAVRGVHTHELYLDAGDTLYGEHLWYEGEATNQWGHYVWRLLPDGRLEKVIPPTKGFLRNYSFVRDRADNMYWPDRRAGGFMKRTPDGRIMLHARGTFRDIRWQTAAPDGTLHFIDDGDLVRITPDGRVTRVARDLRETDWSARAALLLLFRVVAEQQVHDRHNLMGIWTDRAGNTYVAVYGGRLVKKVTPDGRVSIAARSTPPWAPTGGFVAPNGDLWLLEGGVPSATRLRRIARDGSERIF